MRGNCASMHKHLLDKTPSPHFAKYFDSLLNPAAKLRSLEDAGELEVSGRNAICLEDLPYTFSGHTIQFSNYPHAQSSFSKLENFTTTAVCLLFYLPARCLSPSQRFWLT